MSCRTGEHLFQKTDVTLDFFIEQLLISQPVQRGQALASCFSASLQRFGEICEHWPPVEIHTLGGSRSPEKPLNAANCQLVSSVSQTANASIG